jgi:hypothetical protein
VKHDLLRLLPAVAAEDGVRSAKVNRIVKEIAMRVPSEN